ncbi:MAG: hypothetical protein Q8P24_06290 [Desulfobacterales bacterium]|nr:hypothetical protein [Desulfobacterales bacterium]
MTKERKAPSEGPEPLGDILKRVLDGRIFMLDCGHHADLYPGPGKDITIYNGKKPKIICSQCGY